MCFSPDRRILRHVIPAAVCGIGLLGVAAFAQEGFYREYYADITGATVAVLTNAAAFPDSPTIEEIVDGPLATGVNIADYYGQRLRAVITPAVSGSYTFWIASDDQGELWLGTDDSPATRRRIAYVSSYTSAQVWTQYASQCSSAISLTAGVRYYIEALQKENSGGDNLAVAWLVPGSGVTSVIPASVMQPYLEKPAVKTQPSSVEIYEQWAGKRSVSFAVEAARKAGLFYQWQKDGADIPGATQTVYSLLADIADNNRLFRCRLSSLGGAVTSQTARYTFVPDQISPSLTALTTSHDRRALFLTFSEPLLAESVTNGAVSVFSTSVTSTTLMDSGSNVVVRFASPLGADTLCILSASVLDCASPANALTLKGYLFTPAAWAPAPTDLIRGGVEPPGPSSRRTPLTITEINHTPAKRTDGRDIRFVELYNSNPFYWDIGGYRFSGAFDYTVPSGTVIAANSYLVVAPVPADIMAVYGISNVTGGFDAENFDGTSEITLNDELGAWLTTVSYADDPPWPVAADGSGHTLVLARPSYGEREADGWAASAEIGGSPGTAEPARPSAYAAVLFNEVLTHPETGSGFVEIHNTSSAAVSLAGCVIKRDKPSSTGYTVPDGTALPAFGVLAFDETTLGFKINGSGDTLWLFAPADTGGTVIDAVRFGNQERGVACGRYPDGDTAWRRLQTPTPAEVNAPPLLSGVVINEIMYHPISESKNEEYIELYNTGANPVDLTGWKLDGGISYTFSGETIPAGGYLIVPRDRDTLAALYPEQEPLMTGSYDGSLNNTRDTVTLTKPVTVMDTDDGDTPVAKQKNTVVETVTYRDGGAWGPLADGGGSSLERVDPRGDPCRAQTWAASDESQKSAWTTLSFTGPIDNGFTASANGDPNAVTIGLLDSGECLVDTVSVSAAGGDNLVSDPSFEGDGSDWRFMGTHGRSFIETNAAAPDGSHVLHLRAADRCHNGMNIVRGLMRATLAKSGTGTIRVRARWLSGCPELLARTRGSWLETSGDILTTRALGSPGQVNSRAQTNGGPAIFDVIHQPVLPRNGEKVSVYVRAHDPDGVSACTLVYRVDGAAGTNTVSMVPAAGGYFVGEIPAGQSDDALVAFHVEAADAAAATAHTRFPADASRECLVRYNEPLDRRAFGIYRLWVTQDHISSWKTREKTSNDPVDATFVYGSNRVIYAAGTMYAGSPFHSGYTQPFSSSVNIDYEAVFPGDDMFLDDDGVVLSTVGNLGSDTTGIREQFCYSLVHAVKIPHMYRRYIHFYANGTEQNSKKIYEDTEKPNSGMLKHWFPENSGNDFFKVDDWFEYAMDLSAFSYTTARLQKYTTTNANNETACKLSRYRWNWLKRGYETFHANDYTNFFSLIETLNTPDTDGYARNIQADLHLDAFVPVIAVNQFIGNFDSYGFSRGKNMYLYDSADGWQLIAWDLDYNFGMSRPLTDPIDPSLPTFITEDPTMRTFLKTPLVARIFWRAVQKIVTAANDPEIRTFTRAKYDALKADSTNLTGDYDSFFSVVDTRRANVAAMLAAAQNVDFDVVSPSSSVVSSSDDNIVTLTGTAPFGVTTVLINGAATPVTWLTATSWTAQVVLNTGTNLFAVTALDENGGAYSGPAVNLAIAYTGTALDPMAGSLVFSEIMAAPVTNGAAYVELYNRSTNTVMNLSQIFIDGAVLFDFPAGTVLAPGEHIVAAADADVFAAVYGTDAAACVAGTYTGVLGTSGRLLLKSPAAGFDPDDTVIDDVTYDDAYPWPSHTGDGISLQLINPALDNNRVANWSAVTNLQQSTTMTLVPWNQTWRYNQSGDPGTGWTNTTFDDSGWLSGPGIHAYETGTTLPLNVGTTLQLTTGRITYYFRTTFTFNGDPADTALALSYIVDDAVIFYLNGREIHRSSLMPDGEITDTTVATAAQSPEGAIEGAFSVPADALISGVNTLAVGVHQNQTASSDLVFGMKLDATVTTEQTSTPGADNRLNAPLSTLPGVWINEIQPLNVTGPLDNQGRHAPWVELYNAQTTSVSLTGWSLATGENDAGWTFPSDTAIPAGAFLRVWLDGAADAGTTTDPHAGIRFSVTNGLLVLRAPIDDRAVTADYLRVTNAAADAVWGAYPDGASNPRRWLHPATPGASNRIDKTGDRIVINEFMAKNDLYTNPLSGKQDDWFELFNDGTHTVPLGGYIVTDTLTCENPPVPDFRTSKSLVISNSVSLMPGEALRIWTGDSSSTTRPFDPANLQAPFGLSKDGDQICLFNAATQLVDRIVYTTEQTGSASMGRWFNGADGDLVTFSQPTPGEPNRNPARTSRMLAQPPVFALREQDLFCYTNTFVSTRPANFVSRLFPTEGGTVPANLGFDDDTGVLAWTPSETQGPGLYTFRVCGFLTNALSTAVCDETLLTLSVLETPSRPILGPIQPVAVNEGSLAAFTVTVSRAEEIPPYATSTRLRIAGEMPTNATFDAEAGIFRWTTVEADGPSTGRFTVVAEDVSDTNSFVSAVATVTVYEVNASMSFQSPAAFYLWHCEPFSVQLKYKDPDLPPNRITFKLSAAPDGMTLDSATSLLQWQPTADQTGTFTCRIRGTDNAGSATSNLLTFYVDSARLTASALASDGADGLTLKWSSKNGTLYTIQWCESLSAPVWQDINADAPIQGTGEILSYTLSPSALGAPSNAFFRIVQTRE